MFRVVRHVNGPRVYVLGKRVHHGSFGVACGAAFVSLDKLPRRVRMIGACVCACAVWHDRADFPWTDERNH